MREDVKVGDIVFAGHQMLLVTFRPSHRGLVEGHRYYRRSQRWSRLVVVPTEKLGRVRTDLDSKWLADARSRFGAEPHP